MLRLETLETRENPVGPVAVDPIDIPVPLPAEAAATATPPAVTTIVDQIIQNTIAAISKVL